MTVAGYLSLGFAGIALASLVALFIVTRGESITWGRWTSWWSLRQWDKKKRLEQRVILPKAYLVEGDGYEVVRLADTVSRRVVK